MATAKGSPLRFRFHLPVYLEFSTRKKIDSKGLKDVQSYLASDIMLLNKNLQLVKSLPCVCVFDIEVENDHLSFGFILENSQELEDFYGLSRSGTLSKILTTYAEENSLELNAGFGLSSKPRCRIEMDEETYNKAKAFFCEGSDVDNPRLNPSSETQSETIYERRIQGNSGPISKPSLTSVEQRWCEMNFVKTQVILPLRKLQPTEKYESVIVRVTDLNVSNEEHAIQMNATGHNVWRADVFNPVTSQVDKINYFFDVTVSSKGLFGRNYNKMRSTMYKMKEASVIRQVFDETNIPNDEIISHLKDIIIESDALSLLDCTQQIEDFCKDINFKMDAAEQIYKSLLAEIDKSSQKQLLLCIIVFGNLFKSYHTIASRILKPELMWTLLNSLASYNSMDLTVSSSEYMFDVAKVFCRIVLGKQYCFLSAISILYPFFEEKYISNRLIEAVRRKETLVAEPGGEETENIIFTLFEKVFQRAESEQARRLLEQLILHIPLKEAMKIYKNLQTKDSALVISGGIQSVLHATLLESVRLFLRSQKRSIDELKQLMELTDMIQEISIASRSELENAIVSCVISVMRSQTEALKEMILRKDLFVTVKSQLNLIKRLTSLRLPYLHFLLFDILVDAKFVEALSRAENVWFCECFDNAILNIKREGNEPKKQMEDVYTYLARAFEFCALRHSKELITYIDKIGIEYLKAIDLKKLMRMAKVIEELAETNTSIGDLFKEHVQSILKHQYESNYHEMLIDLCGTNGKLRINSSVTASIVNAVINISMPKSDQVLDQFKELVLQNNLWTLVIQATGKEVQKVKENSNYQKIAQILKEMVKKLQEDELPYGYLECVTVKTSKENVISLLTLEGRVTKTEIRCCWNQIQCCFETEVNKINSSCEVLRYIKMKLPSDTVPSNARALVVKLTALKRDIETGEVTASELKNEKMIWNDLQKLPEKCAFLKEYVKSDIFWRSCSTVVKTVFEEKRLVQAEEQTERESFESVHRLFEKDIPEEKDQDNDVCEILLLLEILTDRGIAEYREAWVSLLKHQDRDVGYALALLNDADVEEEIRYAEHNLRQPVPQNVKKTLHRLKNINGYENLVDVVCKALQVFGVKRESSKDIHDAISTFESLKENNVKCPFSTVVMSLEKIDSFSKNLLQDTIDILSVLSGSSSLIEFLKEIVEEDIRNLIDAVEDISEQHVQESTVSALIEIKSFLHGLLIKTSKDLTAQEFLDLINKQTKTARATKIPAKIDECMNSLHNLKSLYGNVANRGEMTAEIIGNIISRGKFSFEIDEEGSCDFCVTYKHGSVREKQTRHSLIDLRSRALLLMNTRTKVHEHKLRGHDLEKFVSYIDHSTEIINLLSDLHHSGNMSFITYNVKKDDQALADLQEQLYRRKMEWDQVLQNLRDEFYLLNFVHGPEIHLLYNCFERKTGSEKVASLLRFIHPDLKLQALLDSYAALKTEERSASNEELLRCFGTMLHNGYEDKQPLQRTLYFKSHSKRLTEVVQNKRLFVAGLEEHSNQVVKTLLSMYMNTTQTLPEPHQVLFCTKDTTWNELELLLNRCLGSFKFTQVRQLFCIANVELLPNELQFAVVEKLRSIDTNEDFLLSLICRGSGKHPFLDELSSATNRSSAMLSDEQLRQAFQAECPGVLTYTSTVPGLGKTSQIKEMTVNSRKAVVKLHLSGALQKNTVIERLRALKLQDYHALHIDIGSVDNVVSLDTFIFELIILRHVSARFKSFSLETDSVYIEVGNTINDTLRNSLNTVMAFKREHLKWENYDNFIVSLESNSPVQVVCQHLNYLANGVMDNKDLQFGLHSSVVPLPPSHCRQLLREYFGGEDNLSFTVVNIFLNVLADQLKKMSCSSFFRVSRILEMTGHKSTPVVRSTLVDALIEASKEFSSRSIKSCRSTQMSTVGACEPPEEEAVFLSCKHDLAEMVNERVDGMIRWEDSNHLIFVFHSQNIQTISPMYRNLGLVPSHIRSLFESQMKKEMQDFDQMNQCELLNLLQKVARANPLPMSERTIKGLNAEYALTPDNLLKMILIMLRVKSNIPVLVMGETGCGKTSLIRYLATVSDVEFEVLSIHAGVEEETIIQTINESNQIAFGDPDKDRWLFLDEINTSEHIGLMTDAICGRTCLGRPLAPNLKVMGACNPYKLRTESAISTAGLKGKVQTDELSKLVYRVLPLPERLVDYVWDFGTLSDKDEAVYIRRMIDDIFPGDNSTLKLLQDLLSASQMFVRKQESVSYCVSLRDIQRCKILIRWFLDVLPKQRRIGGADLKTDSVILALAICYHSRFSSNKQRLKYRKELQNVFMMHRIHDLHEEAINKKILEEQKDILRRMDLPPGTAKNTALQENVFVILVCLLNKITIFLVGKPGCSKSLSMQVIRSNLRGKDSKDDFFKKLPQLYCVSFQGSESSTSDGIIKVFEKATRYQESNNAEEVLSVVILDEIGLAEVSRFNPLKVLHSLLEPDGRAQPDVAVVGISNWALDASKMNRGIHLSRPDMDEEELFQTGVSISESFIESKQSEQHSSFAACQKPVLNLKVQDVLKDIATSYLKYVERLTFKNFHGLRDYYSLVKFISRGFLDDATSQVEAERDAIVFKGLQRNFGGLPAESATLLNMFKIQAKSSELTAENVLKLMEDNISDQLARHLMCITSGDSALGLVESLLTDMNRDEKVVIFGSQFEEDQTADYNYRILSRIILCMEQGFVLILKDLENIYGSLYDMLNQNYTVIGKKKHCRVALGHYSNPICHVHDSFRCIVLVDESKVDYSDPPFLNRFEKQYLRFTDTVNKEEAELIKELNNWTKQFSDAEGGNFDQSDCFPIYSQDMIPSLVIKTSRTSSETDTQEEIFEICKTQLLQIVQSDAVFRLEKNKSEEMRKNAKRIKEGFLQMHIHSGIWQFIEDQLASASLEDEDVGLLTVVLTNSSMHSQALYRFRPYDVQMEKLGAFKSEKQLYVRIQHFWLEATESILFLHCSAAEDEKHISLAKATIDNIRAEVLREGRHVRKHVYLIIHLDRRRAETKVALPINYLSGWEIVTLDSLSEPAITLPQLSTLSLIETVQNKKPLNKYITEQLFWSFSRIRYEKHGRELKSIQDVIGKIENSKEFLRLIEHHVLDWINNEFSGRADREWVRDIALNPYAINTSSSFLVALEQEVLGVIKVPICKLIYQMENMNVTTCFFCEDETPNRKTSLEKMLRDENFFSISKVHNESGPECYPCAAVDLPLRMPFSKLVFVKTEDTKEEFMDTYYKVKEKCNLDEEDELPLEILEQLFSKHEGVVVQSLPDLSDYFYTSVCDDYYHDFCCFVSHTIPSKMSSERKYQVIRWSLEQEIKLQTKNPIELIVKLHAMYWLFSSAFSAEHVLFETCSEIFNLDEHFLQFLGCSFDSFERIQEADSDSGLSEEHGNYQESETVDTIMSDSFSQIEGIEDDDSTELQINTLGPVGTESFPHFGENASNVDFSAHTDVRESNTNVFEMIEDPKIAKGECSAARDDNAAKLQAKTESDLDQTDLNSATDFRELAHVNDTVTSNEQYDDSHFQEERRAVHISTESTLDDDKQNRSEDRLMEAEIKQLSEDILQESNLVSNETVSLNSDTEKKEINCTLKASTSFQDSDNTMSEVNRSLITESKDVVAPYSAKKMNTNPSDSRKELVQFVCRKLLPSRSTLDIFVTIEEWRKRVSVVLTHAVKISSDPGELHSLRFCYDLVSTVGQSLRGVKLDSVLTLGNILQTDGEARLDSPECFECVCDLVFSEPRLQSKDSKKVLSYYLNRCIAADTDTEIVVQFLQLPLDQTFMDNDFDALRSPLQLSLKLSVLGAEEDVFLSLIKDQSDDLILVGFPFLQALDMSLKSVAGTACVDSQFAVLVVDMIEELFNQMLQKLLNCDIEEVKMVLLSAQNIILGCGFGLQFLSAVSFYKSFASYYSDILTKGDFDTSKCLVYLQVMKGLLDKDEDIPSSQAMKRYFIKETGKGKLPWSLYKTFKNLEEMFDFLKAWQWTDNYLLHCIEGNPLLQYAPTQVQILLDILDEKDLELLRSKFQDYLKDNKEGTGLLAVHAVSLSRFYIARRYRQQDDTHNQLAKSLVQIAKEENMDPINVYFLSCILGVSLFPWLELHECSDELHTGSAIFSSSLFALLLAANQESDGNFQLPLLARILLCPSKVEVDVMRPLRISCKAEQKQYVVSEDKEEFGITCTCGYRLFIEGKQIGEDIYCPMCARANRSETKKNMTTKHSSGPLNAIDVYVGEIGQRIIDLCVNACLLGSLGLERSTEHDLEKISDISEIDDIPKTLMNNVQEDFKRLQKSLELNCRDMYIFLQACLLHVKDFITKNKSSVSTVEHVREWTDKLILQLEPLIRDRYRTVIHAVELQSSALQKCSEGPELNANENDTESLISEERKYFFPSLFRAQGKGSRTTFELELHMLAEGTNHPHPFLLLVLDVLPDLALTEHLLSVVRWHMATVTQIECRMKKRQCLEMTVEDFIHFDADKNIRERLQERFERLQEALSTLSEAGRGFEITSQTKMKDCLILDSSSALYTVLKDICEIQNTFLDKVLEVSVRKECNALQFLSKGDGISAIPVISIAQIKPSSVVNYKWDNELLKFSHADLRYGYGAQINYEFEAIEKMLIMRMVAGKSYIMLENSLPSVTFVDEFYKGYGKMAREISDIIPQKPLSTDIVHGIKEKREQHPRLTVELITHIGVLISLVKKTKGEAETPLIEYVEIWKHVLTNPMPSKLLPVPENSVRLCHLTALYGLLEELNADSLVDSLDDKYRKPISFEIQNQLNALFRSNQRLAEMALKATKRFVYRCLSSGDADSTQPLAEYLADDSFWPSDVISYREGQVGPSGYRKSPMDYLPKDLRVHHVSKMISHLGSKLKEFSKKDMKLRDIATSFASRGSRTTAEQKKKLAQKMIV